MLKGQPGAEAWRSVQLPITSLAVTQCQVTRPMMFSLRALLCQRQVCVSGLACCPHSLRVVAWSWSIAPGDFTIFIVPL